MQKARAELPFGRFPRRMGKVRKHCKFRPGFLFFLTPGRITAIAECKSRPCSGQSRKGRTPHDCNLIK